MLQERI